MEDERTTLSDDEIVVGSTLDEPSRPTMGDTGDDDDMDTDADDSDADVDADDVG